MTDFYPVGCKPDELSPVEYLLLLDWSIVHDHALDEATLAWHSQFSLTWWSELTMFRMITRAEERIARKWYRRLWRWICPGW